jgi:hypothetical protein
VAQNLFLSVARRGRVLGREVEECARVLYLPGRTLKLVRVTSRGFSRMGAGTHEWMPWLKM